MAGFAPAAVGYPFVRRGRRLIIPVSLPKQAAILPPQCVRCGAAANGKAVEKDFSWHHPALYLVILAGVLIYVVVASVVTKKIRVRVPLCALHAQRRSTAVTLAWVFPLAGIADAFVLPRFDVDGGWVALVTGFFVLSGIVIWGVVSNPIRPKFINDFRGEFSGFCEAFLQQFPQAGN